MMIDKIYTIDRMHVVVGNTGVNTELIHVR